MSIVVGIADLKVCKKPEVLITYALGSCIGICLYDKISNVSGLSHIMLPNSTEVMNGDKNVMKFADTAIVELIRQMQMLGANKSGLTAKIAGGALMFQTTIEKFNIGARNEASVRKVLGELRIPIIAADTGANYGRTLLFHSEDGKMEIRAATRGVKML